MATKTTFELTTEMPKKYDNGDGYLRWRGQVKEMLYAIMRQAGAEEEDTTPFITDIEFMRDVISEKRYPNLHENSVPFVVTGNVHHYKFPANFGYDFSSEYVYDHETPKVTVSSDDLAMKGDDGLSALLFILVVLGALFVGFLAGWGIA